MRPHLRHTFRLTDVAGRQLRLMSRRNIGITGLFRAVRERKLDGRVRGTDGSNPVPSSGESRELLYRITEMCPVCPRTWTPRLARLPLPSEAARW